MGIETVSERGTILSDASMRVTLQSLSDYSRIVQIQGHARPYIGETYPLTPYNHFDFSIADDIIAAINLTKDEELPYQLNIYNISSGVLIFTFNDRSKEHYDLGKSFESLHLSFDPKGSRESFFLVWQSISRAEIRKIATTPEYKVVGSKALGCADLRYENWRLQVQHGFVHMSGVGFYKLRKKDERDRDCDSDSDSDSEVNSSDDEGVSARDTLPRGQLYYLSFDVTGDQPEQCLASSRIKFRYKHAEYGGEDCLRIVGCGKVYIVLAHSYWPPQSSFTDTYKIYRLPYLRKGSMIFEETSPQLVGSFVVEDRYQ